MVPTTSTFNDFGHYIRAELGFLKPTGTREWFTAFFTLKEKTDIAKFVEELLPSKNQSILLSEVQIPFASLLAESKHYGLLRREMGSAEGVRLLLAVNDISVLSAQEKGVPDWPDFFTGKVFTHAMARTSEGYFAYRHGALYLEGRQTFEVDARQRLSVELTGKGPALSLDFKFDADKVLRGRIAVIIGKNGCGKTSTLSRLAAGLANSGQRGVQFTARPEVNQVLAFAHSGTLALFKHRKDRAGATSIRSFAFDPFSASRPAVRDKQTRLLVDIARSDDDDGSLLRYFKEIIKEEFFELRLFVPISGDADIQISRDYIDSKSLPYIDLSTWMRRAEGKRLSAAGAVDHSRDLIFLDAEDKQRELSLGQAAFLNFALTALANAGPASVLLIDEPENFLHPNLISRFMRVLHKILEGTQSIAIVATHSPFVVREVQSAQVHVIRPLQDESVVQVAQPRLQTLGANVAAIADEVFRDDLPEHLFELLLQQANLNSLPFSEVLEHYAKELSIEALMLLRQKSEGNRQEVK
ncbi:MAG: AAA family ATPase [Proteobacteria bacterium]|nr:AAA family ATPase [Pseudomonadota bacterium]